jgi:putative sigma-54 modulation protein
MSNKGSADVIRKLWHRAGGPRPRSDPLSASVIGLSQAAGGRTLDRTPGATRRHRAVGSNPMKGNLMNLTISGHHLEVTAPLREYVLTKLDRVTRHFDQVVDINVLLSIEKQKEKERRQKAEVTLHVKGKDIFVESAHQDLYAAIDELIDKLDRQVCRHKDRVQDHHHESPKRLGVVDLQ